MLRAKKENSAVLPNSPNQINQGTVITGNIVCEGHLRIDGRLDGDIQVKGKLVIGPEGFVKGNVTCGNLDLMGKVEGNLTVSEHAGLKNGCQIQGDLNTTVLTIEEGAVFHGFCQMRNHKMNVAVSPEKKKTEAVAG
jgi:cytoskeletal protein CcmA (bactofilin family)